LPIRTARFPPLGQRRLTRTRRRTLSIETCAGRVQVRAAYGWDPLTGQWGCPARQRWGLEPFQRLSPVLEERLCFTATLTGSYEAAAEVAGAWGVAVTDSLIHTHVQKAGQRAEACAESRMRRALAPETRAEVAAEAGRETPEDFDLAIMMDGWMARERGADWGLKPPEKQGDRVAWHEMKAGIVFRLDARAKTQTGRRALVEKFVEMVRGEPFEFGQRLYALALRHGLAQARRVFVVSDGAAWIWNLAAQRFGPVIGILDFYHASEHLWTLGRELFEDEEKARRWVEPLLHKLRHGQEAAVLKKLERTLGRAAREGSAAEAAARRETHYFHDHREHVHYEQWAAQGIPIGSGAMESACGQFQGRLKGPGKFWTVDGKRNLAALDIARRNHEWDFDSWRVAA
jgi:hypothetical protein